ncbi:MAG: FAD-dependent oxidoreductase [Thermodesulfobacteriota bacterium]
MTRYVIVGQGVAGATAAEKIRTLDQEGPLAVFSNEPEAFYYRPRLPEVISGQAGLKQITIHPQAWYDRNRIDLRLGETVTAIDPEARQVVTDRGGRHDYDALLLATGAHAFIPPVPGREKRSVLALRSHADALKIAARAREVKAAVLVGGGLLGLEAGAGLARLGLQVQVVEFFDRLLPRQMDRTGAAKLRRLLEAQGFLFYLGAKAREIVGGAEAEGLALEDGQTLPGGLILFSAGIRPNLDLAAAIGLEIEKGVKVDDAMKTSRAGIWAAGDLIEHRGRSYGIWPASKEQGEVAGTVMAGGEAAYKGTVLSNSLKVVGVDLTSAGDIDAEGKLESVVYEDEKSYRKIVLDQGRLAGFIFFGLTRGVKECQAALAQGLDVRPFQTALRERDFDFSKLT